LRLEIIDKTAPVVSIALPVNLCVGQGCLPSLEKFPIPEYLFSIPNNIGIGIQGQAEKRANLPYFAVFLASCIGSRNLWCFEGAIFMAEGMRTDSSFCSFFNELQD